MKKIFLLVSVLLLLSACISFHEENSVTRIIPLTISSKEEFKSKIQNTLFDDDGKPIYVKEFEGLENIIDFNIFNQIQTLEVNLKNKNSKQNFIFKVVVAKYLDNLKTHHFSLDNLYKVHSFNQNKLLVSLYKYVENSESMQFNRSYSTKLLSLNLDNNEIKEIYDFSSHDFVITDAFEKDGSYFVKTHDRLPTKNGEFKLHKSYDYLFENNELKLIHSYYSDNFNPNSNSVSKNINIFSVYKDIDNNKQQNYLGVFNWNYKEVSILNNSKTEQELKLFDSYYPTITKDNQRFAYIKDGELILDNKNSEMFDMILDLKSYHYTLNKQKSEATNKDNDNHKIDIKTTLSPYHYVITDDIIYYTKEDDFNNTIHIIDLIGLNSSTTELNYKHNNDSNNSFLESYLLKDDASIININSKDDKELIINQYNFIKLP